MTIAEKRQQLIIYLTDAEDKKVSALYSLLEDNLKVNPYSLTDEHLQILEEREAEYLSGNAEPSPWQEVHDRIRNKRKRA